MCPKAVERTAPIELLLYRHGCGVVPHELVIDWFVFRTGRGIRRSRNLHLLIF